MPKVTRKIRVPSVNCYTAKKESLTYSLSESETNTVGYTDSNYPLAPTNTFYTVFEWETISLLFDVLGSDASDASVVSISFDFYYRYADNLPNTHSLYDSNTSSFIRSVDIKYGFGELPSLAGTDELTFLEIASSDTLTTVEIRGDKKTRKEILLPDLYDYYTSLQNELEIDGQFFIAFGYSASNYDSNNQILEIGGNTQTFGTDNLWEGLEPYHQPEIVITLEFPSESDTFTFFDLKYTTQDPTTAQNSPENSLGGYISSNSVFESSYVLKNVSLTDDEITLNSDSEIPNDTNPAQFGYELIKYTSSSEDILDIQTREMNLDYGKFISVNDSISQKIFYLNPENLFNTNPTDESLIHYRCVFLQNLSNNVLNTSITLINPEDSNIDIQIAVEMPDFDYLSGIVGSSVTSGSRTFTSPSFGFIGFEDDHFKNGHVIFNRETSPSHAIITSFTESGGTSTFTVDRNLPAIAGASNFEVMSAPSHSISNEQHSPDATKISNFISNGESLSIRFADNTNNFVINSGFYVWIKRTLQKNKQAKPNSGSIIRITYKL